MSVERVEYDAEGGAGYIYVDDVRSSYERTVEVAEGVNIDFGIGGKVLGIEILWPTDEFIKFAEGKR